jgi:hypothetical protein
MSMTELDAIPLTLWTCIQEASGSNLGVVTSYSHEFLYFPPTLSTAKRLFVQNTV